MLVERFGVPFPGIGMTVVVPQNLAKGRAGELRLIRVEDPSNAIVSIPFKGFEYV